MGVYLSGSYNRSLRPLLGSAARKAAGFRRLVASRRGVQGRATVEFSPLAHELRELERIQFAAEGCCSSSVGLPAPSAALTSGRMRSASLASAHRVRPDLSTEGGER